MAYINNYLEPIELAQGATSAALNLPDGEYRLTLSDAARANWEIVDAIVTAGSATLTRAREGTTDQGWPEGSVIYCAVTAGQLNDLLATVQRLDAALSERVVTVGVSAGATVAGFYMLNDVRQGTVTPSSVNVPGFGDAELYTVLANSGVGEFSIMFVGEFDPAKLVHVEVQGIGTFLLSQAIDSYSEQGATGWAWATANAGEWLSAGDRTVTFKFAY
ncbi:hypothetical protein [Stutzerimonas kunmingensis]|uniref:hypothetical protein n=1 Tax=Stutzerimonas kunmingensis TaxID=1211807 RepID=UPI00241D6B22|nr:hypothetical protein [Stutzerimonas kunmingensis]